MPAWPGGDCPNCGDDMPANLVRCRTCRSLLNSDLHTDTVEIPAFVPLQEIATMVDVEPEGFYIDCPECARELRIAKKYLGEHVGCKFCHEGFIPDLGDPQLISLFFYTRCPECEEELRVARKYIGQKVACKYCGGKIHFVQPSRKSS